MHALRQARLLARLVLAWFVAFVAVAGFAPMLAQAQPIGAICTSSSDAGGTLDDGTTPAPHVLKCALCAGWSAPPPVATVAVAAPQPLGHAVQPVVAARIAALTRAPLPARGPPLA